MIDADKNLQDFLRFIKSSIKMIDDAKIFNEKTTEGKIISKLTQECFVLKNQKNYEALVASLVTLYDKTVEFSK